MQCRLLGGLVAAFDVSPHAGSVTGTPEPAEATFLSEDMDTGLHQQSTQHTGPANDRICLRSGSSMNGRHRDSGRISTTAGQARSRTADRSPPRGRLADYRPSGPPRPPGRPGGRLFPDAGLLGGGRFRFGHDPAEDAAAAARVLLAALREAGVSMPTEFARRDRLSAVEDGTGAVRDLEGLGRAVRPPSPPPGIIFDRAAQRAARTWRSATCGGPTRPRTATRLQTTRSHFLLAPAAQARPSMTSWIDPKTVALFGGRSAGSRRLERDGWTSC